MTSVAAAPIVYVVDDDVSIRESLEHLLRSAGCRPQIFGSAVAFLGSPRVDIPGCVILDVSLPDLDGLEIQQRIAHERRALPIIFITGHRDVPMTVQAMKAGAVEFLTKPFHEDALMAAVESAIERSTVALEQQSELQELDRRFDSLSPREQSVMALVVRGLLNKQVAAQLGISEITVKAHRGKVMRKMKARSFADLVKMTADLGFDPTPKG
jgi:FixJ family two-component response regulator